MLQGLIPDEHWKVKAQGFFFFFFFIDTLKETINKEKTRTRWEDAYHLSRKRGGLCHLQ